MTAKWLCLVCVSTLIAFAGCKKKGGGADMTAKMTEFKDAMCKCPAADSACAQKVIDDQRKWSEEMAKSADKGAAPDPEAAKKLEPITAEYSKCMTAAMTPKEAPKTADAPKDEPTPTEPAEPKPAVPAGALVCPPGSTGKGTQDEECTSKGRVVEATWTGGFDANQQPEFTVKNSVDAEVDFAQMCVYYYDKDGKPLGFNWKSEKPTDPKHICDASSGGVLAIGPKETKKISYGMLKADLPKGTAKIEIEFNKIGWNAPGKEGDEMYWVNDSLTAKDRPVGGHPQN